MPLSVCKNFPIEISKPWFIGCNIQWRKETTGICRDLSRDLPRKLSIKEFVRMEGELWYLHGVKGKEEAWSCFVETPDTSVYVCLSSNTNTTRYRLLMASLKFSLVAIT